MTTPTSAPRPAAHLRAIVRERIGEVETAARVLHGAPLDAEPLHEFRRASRRLEASVLLLEAGLAPTALVRARWLAQRPARGMGKHRDADVQRRALERLADEAPADVRSDIRAIRRRITPKSRAREADVKQAARAVERRRLRAPLERLLERADAAVALDPLAHELARVRLRAQASRAPDATAQVLHAFQLETKLLRYGVEMLARDEPSLAPAAEEAAAMTDVLGRMTDARALRRAVAQHEAKHADGARWVAARANEVESRERTAFVNASHALAWPHLDALLVARGA